jgi:iron(III) transport system ATP-binding protein
VADFIGQGRFLQATLLSPDTLDTELGRIVGNRAFLWAPGTRLEVLLRPDDVIPAERDALRGVVVKKAFKGAEILYTVRLGNGIELLSLFPSHDDRRVGDSLGVRIRADHLVAFPVA